MIHIAQTRRRAAAILILFLTTFSTLPAHPDVPSLEDYLREPQVRAVSMSPDGTKLAVVKRHEEDEYRLYVLDLENQNAVRSVITEPDKKSITNVHWLNNERVGVTLTGKGNIYGYKIKFNRMIAFDFDGANPLGLLADRKELATNFDLADIVSLLPEDPEYILILGNHYGANIYKVNIYTGASEIVTKGGSHTIAYRINASGEANLRFDFYGNSRRLYIMSYDKSQDQWEKITRIRLKDLEDEFDRVIATFDGDETILMLDRKDGDEFQKLHRYNIHTKEFTDVAREIEGHDVHDLLVEAFSDEIIGLQYITDRPQFVYFDKDVQRIQSFLEDQLSNGMVKILSLSEDRKKVLFFSGEPWHPGSFFVYDDDKKNLMRIIDIAPQIRENSTTSVDVIKYGSVDQMLVDGYLTFPVASSGMNMPLIIFPHGGPVSRDLLEYDTFVQYWATRGYAIFQPNFRGSSGYGHSFEKAGYQEYGGLMIDDIAAGVRALIKAGRVDPDRVCSAGISYGGYASLMLGIKTDLIKCVVSINGPTDRELRIKRKLRDIKNKDERRELREIFDEQMGNIDSQTDLLRHHSPFRRAAEMKPPVLLIHALDDSNVGIVHSRKMNKALRRADKNVEFLKLKKGGHGLHWGDAEEIVLKKTEAFFAKHLKSVESVANVE